MRAIGTEILSEYVSEVDERIEDDKSFIRIGQGLSFTHSIFRILRLTATTLISAFAVLFICTLLLVDASTLEEFRSAPSEDLIKVLYLYKAFAIIGTFLALLIVLVTSNTRYFQNKKLERIEREQERTDLLQTIIEINEEMLFRHGLIKKEGADND